MPGDVKAVCGWGGGVQSTTIGLMVLLGRLPRPDAFIFADTGDEPDEVYEHTGKWAVRFAAAGLAFYTVRHPSGQSLSEHVLARASAGKGGISMPPVYVPREASRGRMPVWRGCTRDFKVVPIERKLKALMDGWGIKWRGYRGAPQVEHWLGISHDERQRMKTSTESWRRFAHPLADRRMTRTDCIALLKRHGETAPRSACVYCPFHSDAEWRRIAALPRELDKAVAFEEALQAAHNQHGAVAGLRGYPTLHPSGVPLRERPFDARQLRLGEWQDWRNECAGVCGV